MKRAIKAVIVSAATILLAAAGLVAAVVMKPGWFLNSATAVFAIRHWGKAYRPQWKGLSLRVDSESLRDKRLVFRAEDFCADRAGPPGFHGCFRTLELDVRLRLGGRRFVRLVRLEKLGVLAGPRIGVDMRAAGAPPPRQKKAAPKGVPSWASWWPTGMTVGALDVRIPRADVVTATGTATVVLSAVYPEKKEGGPLVARILLAAPGKAGSPRARYRLDASLDSDLLRRGALTRLEGRAALRGAGLSARLEARVRTPRLRELRWRAVAEGRFSGRGLRVRGNGVYSPRRLTARADLSVEDPVRALRRAALERCRLDAPLDRRGPTSADLKCAVAVEPRNFLPGTRKKGAVKGELDLHADFRRVGLQSDHFTAGLAVDLGPDPTWYGFFAHVRLKLAGRTGRLPATLTVRHDARVGFMIRDFKEVVSALKDTELAIPAPLNALSGRVSFAASSIGNSLSEGQRVDYSADTALSSERQRLFVAVEGSLAVDDILRPSRRAKDRTDVELRDVALELPYLRLGPVPVPVPDSRIKTGRAARDKVSDAERSGIGRSTATAVDYELRVRTGKPVVLRTNLNKDPIPIALNVSVVPAGAAGRVLVEPFDVEVFRQKAHVDHLAVTLEPGNAPRALDGKIVYTRSGVVVNILLLGTVEKPVVAFQSEPPMAQSEIVALLLYGKTPAELDSDQTATAGTALEGFTSGAFGLASLYLFATTPVDSVTYDPASQTYEVNFKLPGGATLGVGSNLEESRVLTLRERVTRNVMVETRVERSASTGQTVRTFLEWFRRF